MENKTMASEQKYVDSVGQEFMDGLPDMFRVEAKNGNAIVGIDPDVGTIRVRAFSDLDWHHDAVTICGYIGHLEEFGIGVRTDAYQYVLYPEKLGQYVKSLC